MVKKWAAILAAVLMVLLLCAYGAPGIANNGPKGDSSAAIEKPQSDLWLAKVKVNGKCGFIDRSGKMVIPAEFDDVPFDFSEGLADVQIRGQKGYIDTTSKLVIPAQFAHALPFKDGLAWVCDANWQNVRYIDKNGEVVFSQPGSFVEGLMRTFDGHKLGYRDHSGRWVIPARFEEAGDFSDGMALVKLDGKYGFIDKSGQMVIQARFDRHGTFSEGLAPVMLDGKWGFIDKSGKMVIPAEFDQPGVFQGGLATVRIKGKSGYIDKSGRIVIPFQYDSAQAFAKVN